ncbi:plasmid pRiA4b ORF-3-like protein [Hirsutella rhossiliensis]|uniref:Plasmid pRiA4b ORF-3-like protein n=1 Tax=Hirsutella rhossiliensis TaxID=111463 RepID=A0A9P8SMJ5_9HYPO|nr:plasmid pRiA4b ORF-3-like protein [Hirsutella rhossiliensis]KAH0968658.1 plasmid pRiA4b ORF-3-like protein [Hirsutella rhossiliensis]
MDKCGNAGCTKPSSFALDTNSLQRCSRCRKAAYCSRECQSAAWPSHKGACVRPNYIIKFHLGPEHITNPPVTRTLSCPAHVSFYGLHLALQTAFGWATTHSFDFAVLDPDYREPTDVMEVMRRRMALGPSGDQLPASEPREYLFRIVDPVEQTMFSGIDRMHESTRRHANTPEKKADKYRLFQLLDDAQFQNPQIVYTYDFGDNWEHYFTVLGRADSTDDFVCLDGSGHYVAEDSRGVNGWEDLKAAYRAQNPTKEQRERRQWFESMASNPDPRGLAGDRVNAWDRDQINRDLETDIMFKRFEAMGDAASAFQGRASAAFQFRQ